MEKINPHRLLVDANSAGKGTSESRELYIRACGAFEKQAAMVKLKVSPLLRAADCATSGGDMPRAGRLLLEAHDEGTNLKSYAPHLLFRHGLLLRKDRHPDAPKFVDLAMEWYLKQDDPRRAIPLIISVANMSGRYGQEELRKRLFLKVSQLYMQRADEKGVEAKPIVKRSSSKAVNYAKALQYARRAGDKNAETEILQIMATEK